MATSSTTIATVRLCPARNWRAESFRTWSRAPDCRVGGQPEIPIIRSVLNVQEATAKALLVETAALTAAQRSGDVLGANTALMDAYHTDARPLPAELRIELDLDREPIAAYARSGYFEESCAERVGGEQAGWGA